MCRAQDVRDIGAKRVYDIYDARVLVMSERRDSCLSLYGINGSQEDSCNLLNPSRVCVSVLF